MYFVIQKILSKLILILSAFFYLTQPVWADDFLNTDDFEIFTVVEGNGLERGFYFQVSFVFDQDTIPKQSLLPYSEPVDEALINRKLIELEPDLNFENNSADCDVFQVYYTTDDFIADGTKVTYAYLISVNSKELNKGCSLSIYNSKDSAFVRKIEYKTSSGEK